METKIAALQAHISQFSDMDALTKRVRTYAKEKGTRMGAEYAEAFVRIDIR